MPNHRESNEQPSLGDILKEGILEGKNPSLTVISDSMSPLLKCGDLVGLQQFDRTQLNPGHIVTYTYPHMPLELFTHRVAGISHIDDKTKLITWADRTLMFDFPIEFDDVVGRVIWRKRNGRLLDLDSGRGAWLSDKLSKLATSELKRITKLNIDKDHLSVEGIARSDELRRKGKSIYSVRLLRRIIFVWATLLASIVETMP